MSEIRTARQFIVDFIERNKALMGGIEVVTTAEGKTIDLNNMSDEEASEAAEILMGIGNPTRLGSLVKKR